MAYSIALAAHGRVGLSDSACLAVAANRPLVRELVVTGPKSPEIKSLDDLSGKTEYVRASTSYAESLAMLSIGRSPGLAEGDVGVVTEWNYRKRMLAENSLLPTREGQAE